MSQNYYYGRPDNEDTYDLAMSILAGREKLNSYKTSSLPLAQFWRPQGLKKRIEKLLPTLNLDVDEALKCFEYATPVPGGFGVGKASMTDLMLIAPGKYRIAVEAKYTEYKNLKYDQPVSKWLEEDNPENRKRVLNGWRKLIERYSKVFIPEKDIPYQLVHRIASACAGNEKPVVVYHLFWDDELADKVDEFAERLWHWIGLMQLNGVEFFIAKTKVSPRSDLKCYKKRQLPDLFLRMHTRPYGDMSETQQIPRCQK